MIRRPAAVSILCVLTACSITDEQGPDLSISVSSDGSLPRAYTFRVVVAGETHELELQPPGATRYSIERQAPRTGDLAVSASLLNASGTAVAQASFTQRYEDGSNHWVAAQVGLARPLGHCIGSLIAVPIVPAFAPPRTDSMFVMYGHIPKGAIC